MTKQSETASTRESTRANAFVTILWIGLVAGTLDISDNLIFNHFRGITPTMVFQYIAAGLIGMRSVDLGAASVALGVVLHYFIAISWTAIFYLASRRFEFLRRWPATSGLAYGAFVYLFMNLIIVPLSNVPHVHSAVTLANRINGVLAVVIFIGLTISLLTSAATQSGSA